MSERLLKGWLVDLKTGTMDVVEFEDKLDTLYNLCNCNTIDITVRKIGNYEYDIVCDDEGLLIDRPIATAFNSKKEAVLFGNLLFVNHDSEGNLASLSDEQIKDIKKHLGTYFYSDESWVQMVPCVVDCEYC